METKKTSSLIIITSKMDYTSEIYRTTLQKYLIYKARNKAFEPREVPTALGYLSPENAEWCVKEGYLLPSYNTRYERNEPDKSKLVGKHEPMFFRIKTAISNGEIPKLASLNEALTYLRTGKYTPTPQFTLRQVLEYIAKYEAENPLKTVKDAEVGVSFTKMLNHFKKPLADNSNLVESVI